MMRRENHHKKFAEIADRLLLSIYGESSGKVGFFYADIVIEM